MDKLWLVRISQKLNNLIVKVINKVFRKSSNNNKSSNNPVTDKQPAFTQDWLHVGNDLKKSILTYDKKDKK